MYFIDVQGTLIDDANKAPIYGAIEFIKYLNSASIAYVVITNNTKRSSEDFLGYLNSIGFDIPKEKYLDPLMILDLHVKKNNVAAFGADEFLEVLENKGFELNYTEIETVLVAIKEDYSADEYALMIEAIVNGATLVGMHETTLYAKNSKRYPGVGAILKMLEFATSCKYSVVGKPSIAFYTEALEMIKKQCKTSTFNTITIISDDVKGDLVGAQHLGMKSVFVLSGKYTNADEIIPKLNVEDRPHQIFKTIGHYKEAQ